MSFEQLEMPPIEVRGKHYTYRKNDSVFAANARLLQSIWRLEHFGDEVIVADETGKLWGNLIPTDKGDDYPTNFLSDNIRSFVQKKIDSGEIEEKDILNNLMLTQALIYNLFVEMTINKRLATSLFSKLFPNKISEVMDISFNTLSSQKPLYDQSKVNVALTYSSPSGNKGFFGIELKYAEDLTEEITLIEKQQPISTFEINLFKSQSMDSVYKTPLVHIWKKHKLCLNHIANENYDEGLFLLIYPKKNEECYLAVKEYQETFIDSDSAGNAFCSITLEKIINVLKELDKSKWITDFENRYLRFEKIDMIIGHDKHWEGIMLQYQLDSILEQSIKSLNGAITKHPDYPEAYFWKAQTLKMLNRFEEEVKCYDQAILSLKDKPDLSSRLLSCIYSDKHEALFKLGRTTEVWEELQNLFTEIENYKDDDNIFLYAGERFLENGMFKEAFEIAKRLLILGENDESIEFMRKTRTLANEQGIDFGVEFNKED